MFLPGESPWTEEPGGLRARGSRATKHRAPGRTTEPRLPKASVTAVRESGEVWPHMKQVNQREPAPVYFRIAYTFYE